MGEEDRCIKYFGGETSLKAQVCKRVQVGGMYWMELLWIWAGDGLL
jgi:hypothetical protein